MKCPLCSDTNLAKKERDGIAIEQCPKCGGVWLEAGGLDTIVERAAARPTILQIRRAPLPGYSVPRRPLSTRFRVLRR